MMREGSPAYENATNGFDGIDMESANRRATRRVSTTNAVLGGCVPSRVKSSRSEELRLGVRPRPAHASPDDEDTRKTTRVSDAREITATHERQTRPTRLTPHMSSFLCCAVRRKHQPRARGVCVRVTSKST